MNIANHYASASVPDNETIKSIIEKNYAKEINHIELNKIGGSILYIAYTNSEKLLFKYYTSELLNRSFDYDCAYNVQEHLFLNNINVPKPIRTINNDISVKILYQSKTGVGYLYEFINGQDINLASDMEKVFELFTKMNITMKNYKNPLPNFDYDFYFKRLLDIFNYYYEHNQLINDLNNAVTTVWDKIKVFPREFSHGDLGLHNMIKKNNELFFYDFDSVSFGFKMFDIILFCDCNDFFHFNKQTMTKSKELILKFSDYYSNYSSISQKEIDSYIFFYIMRYFEVSATVAENHIIQGVDDFLNQNYIMRIHSWVMQALEFALR